MNNSLALDNSIFLENCPLCKSSDIISLGFIYYKKPIPFSSLFISLTKIPELYKCKKCNSRFVQNIASEKDSQRLYSFGDSSKRWVKYSFEEDKTNDVIQKISEILHRDLNVLEVGCAAGAFLDYAKKYGCNTFGIEYSKTDQSILLSNGHKAYSSIDELEPNLKLDLIVAFDVVEHLYDVNLFLDTCIKKLSPDGTIIIVTGDVASSASKLSKNKWWYINCPEHIVFPSINFLRSKSNINVKFYGKVFANKRIERKGKSINSWLIALVKFLLFRYDAYPPIFPDHMLVVLSSK